MTLINKMNLINKEYSFATYAESYKKSGDILMENQQEKIALYLYRHSIELSLKHLSSVLGIKFENNHSLFNLFEAIEAKLKYRGNINDKKIGKMKEIIKKYNELDERSTFIRYPLNKEGKENLIGGNLFSTIDKSKEKESVNQYFENFYSIDDVLVEEKIREEEMKSYYEKEY